MGLVKAALGAASGVMGDQWKEYFTCSALPADVLAVKGEKKQSGRSANRHGSENIITDGSIVAVAEGQCALIVEQGKVVDLCAEPGEYTYNTEEGCLSLEGVRPTRRWKSIKVQYETADGKPRIRTFTGWTAQIIQHEIDHCDGILI